MLNNMPANGAQSGATRIEKHHSMGKRPKTIEEAHALLVDAAVTMARESVQEMRKHNSAVCVTEGTVGGCTKLVMTLELSMLEGGPS